MGFSGEGQGFIPSYICKSRKKTIIVRITDDDNNHVLDTFTILVGEFAPATVNNSTIFSKDRSPYILNEKLVISNGGDLTIQPGCDVIANRGLWASFAMGLTGDWVCK